MADELLQIRVTADFKEAEGAFLRLGKVATSFESNIRSISANLNKEFNKIVGSAELFGNSTNVVKDKMDALKNAMVSLLALGFQPMNPEVQKLKQQYDGLANTLTPIAPKIKQVGKDVAEAGNSVKKSNQQWTNWALVLQDLPYGFRGIQNNLPALVGGIAGMTGIIYFAASAVIALYTAYDQGSFKSKAATEAAKAKTEQLKKEKEATDSLYNSTVSEAVEVSSLIAVIKNETETRNRKFSALEQLKKINPEIFNGLVLEKNEVIGIDAAYKNYIESLKTIIAVKIKQAELESVIAKRLKAEGVTLSQEEKNIQATGKALNTNRLSRATDLQQRKELVAQQIKEAKSQAVINDLKKQEEDILSQIQSLSTGIKVTTSKDASVGKEAQTAKARVALENKTTLDVLNIKQQTYKDDILLYKYYQDLIINLEEKQALEEANKIEASELTLQNIRDIAIEKRIKNRQDLSDKIKKLVEDDVKVELDAEKEKEKVSKDFKNSYNSFNKQQESSFKQFYKTKLDLATGDSAAQKEILLDQRAQIEEGLVLGATSWDNYTKDVGENVKKTAELAKQIAKEAMDSLLKIGNGIMTALGPSVDMLIDKGATIGEVLSKAFQDLIKTLTKVIITAAIAVLLISILFPSMLQTAGGALKLFGGLVGQGMGIGGLIGGGSNTGGSKGVDASSGTNTINAAQANSTSNNNGQFVLRGSDLVLALNRSETSLNLRRGS